MSILAALNTIPTPKVKRTTGISAQRQKLLDRLNDQIALAKASSEGKPYQHLRYRRHEDLESGDVTPVPVKTRVRPWWIEQEDGSVVLCVKYGSRLLEVQKGKGAIQLSGRAEIIPTLELVAAAVRAGELDAQINGAVEGFRERFKK